MEPKPEGTTVELKLNQSAIVMFMKCPEKARRVFLEKEFSPIGLPAHRGIAVHEASKENFSQKVKSFKDMKPKDVVERAVTALQTNVKELGVYLDDEEKTVGMSKLLNKTEKTVAELAEAYAVEVAPLYQPQAVEVYHEFPLPEGGVVIHGQIDMETINDEVFDLKTANSMRDNFSRSLQFLMYPLLYFLRYGRHAQRTIIERLIEGKGRTQPVIIEQRTEGDYAALLEQVNEVSKQIRAGIFPGAYGDPAAWWCSKKYCAFWSTCRFVPPSQR